MLVKTFSAAVLGIDANLITIEVNHSSGAEFGYTMVGLPEGAVRESYARVFTALRHNDFEVPRGKLTINLAPADIRKEGSAYDLPIAIGIAAASKFLKAEDIAPYVIMGELSLDGSLRPIKGALPIAVEARKQGFKGFILPKANAAEAAIVNQLDIIPVDHLEDAVRFLEGSKAIEPMVKDTREVFQQSQGDILHDFADVKGQEHVKRALEVAAAGGHNAIMIGPPGAGKTMLAKRMSAILPPMSLHEALETTKVHSVAGMLDSHATLVAHRPYRAPHHTISDVALVGGGTNPSPGEISMAHNGILFLDELPEFKRSALEVLRQPLEDRMVTVSRARLSVDFPANFMLVASMNPWSCEPQKLPFPRVGRNPPLVAV